MSMQLRLIFSAIFVCITLVGCINPACSCGTGLAGQKDVWSLGAFQRTRATGEHAHGHRIRLWVYNDRLLGEVSVWNGDIEAATGEFVDGRYDNGRDAIDFTVTVFRSVEPSEQATVSFSGRRTTAGLVGRLRWHGASSLSQSDTEKVTLPYNNGEQLKSFASVADWKNSKLDRVNTFDPAARKGRAAVRTALNRRPYTRDGTLHAKRCARDPDSSILIDTLEYRDFDKDGSDEAVVRAFSCHTHTAGADVHEVYRASTKGRLEPIDFHDAGPGVKRSGPGLPLVGNLNFTFAFSGQRLCRRFSDSSGRPDPLVECYVYKADAFHLVEVTTSPVFATSFDCSGAKSDYHVTVCGNERLAALDRELDGLQRARMASAGTAERQRLAEDHESWRALGDGLPLAGFDDVIEQAYRERIATLQNQRR